MGAGRPVSAAGGRHGPHLQAQLSGLGLCGGIRRLVGAQRCLTDVLGIVAFTNDLLIDPIRRAESPLDLDEHLADEERRAGTLLGDVPDQFTDESEHLADREQEDIAGTADYTQVMEDGMTWNPPSSPTPEGIRGSDAGPEDMGERH